MITQQHLHDATPRVLQRLRNLVVLPSMGTVGGQSVASLFFEELGLDMRGPINDVDIFVPAHMPREERGVFTSHGSYSPRKNPTAHTNHSLIQDGSSGYGHVKFICARSNVTILRTYQDGLRNFTLIRHTSSDSDRHNLSVSQDIVSGFDLNMVQVGINIKHEQVVFSDDFLKFLNTRTLKIATCNTPTHTLIRLTNKVFGGEIHNVLCDYEREKGVAITHLQLVDKHQKMLSSYPACGVVQDIGQKYVQMANKFSQHLPPLVASPVNQGLFRFDCSALEITPQYDELVGVFSAANNKNFSALLSSTLVSNFPKVFALAENRHTAKDAWERFKTATTGTLSLAQTIHTVQSVLHNQELLHSAMTMPDNESILFFNDQHVSKDPDKVQSIIEHYNTLSAFDRVLLRHNQIRADRFDYFLTNKATLGNEHLQQHPLHALIEVGEEAKNEAEMSVFFSQVLSHIQNPKQARGLDNDILDNDIDDTGAQIYQEFTGGFRNQADQFLRHYSTTQKIEHIENLFKLMPLHLQIQAAPELVELAYNNSVYNPQWWSTDFWMMENGFVQFLTTTTFSDSTPQQQEFVQHMLNHVTDSQLMANNGKMLRNLLKNDCYYESVKQRVFAMDERWRTNGVFSDVCNRSEIHPWGDRNVKSEVFTKLVLELELSASGATARQRRKL